jgi:carbonic anhydrase
MLKLHRPVTAGLIALMFSFGASATEARHWSYGHDTGPDKWAALDPDNKLCKIGQQQSPIALQTGKSTRLAEHDFDIRFGKAKGQLTNNGHTIQFNLDSAADNTVTLKNATYNLAQFHFHTPSEHRLDGKSFPMEMHLVSKDADGKLTVVGVFIKAGAKNEALAKLWSKLPTPNASLQATEVDLATLLPAKRSALVYAGSLTTPPCSEDVNWIVLEQPIQMSQQQINAFRKHFTDNHRPIQRSHERKVMEES